MANGSVKPLSPQRERCADHLDAGGLMVAVTYGTHAETAAAALNRLILDDVTPIGDDDVKHLLRCRDGAVSALQQRLHGFGLAPRREREQSRSLSKSLRLTGLDTWLTTLVSRIAFESHPGSGDTRTPPSEILTRRSENSTVELWRRAAVELLAGSHALDLSRDQPWLRDRGTGWYLMRDTAVVAEALVVLDSRLQEIGLLPGHDTPHTGSMGVGERRLIASQCARVATWYATSDAADQATPFLRRDTVLAGPVVVVSSPSDIATAQRQLAKFLTPVHGNDSTFVGDPHTSATEARQLMASQLFVCRSFTNATAQRSGSGAALQTELSARAEILGEIQPRLRYLVDVNTPEPNRHRIWQQGEITTAIRRMQRDRVTFRLTEPEAQELAGSTHEVLNNLARCLRRELFQATSNLRISDPSATLGARRLSHGSPLAASLTDLAIQPAPKPPAGSPRTTARRAALRHTLDLTPTRDRPPSPYPPLERRRAPTP